MEGKIKPLYFMGAILLHWLLSGGVFAKAPLATISDTKNPPNIQEWQQFMALNPEQLQGVWSYHQNIGTKWENWGWQWKIGWLKRAITLMEPLRQKILLLGFKDKAILVKGESAQLIGQIYHKSGNKDVESALLDEIATWAPMEQENSKATYVRQKVLFAAFQVLQPEDLAKIETRIKSNEKLASYWEKIQPRSQKTL